MIMSYISDNEKDVHEFIRKYINGFNGDDETSKLKSNLAYTIYKNFVDDSEYIFSETLDKMYLYISILRSVIESVNGLDDMINKMIHKPNNIITEEKTNVK